jgi:hypothetical protein
VVLPTLVDPRINICMATTRMKHVEKALYRRVSLG